MDAVTYMRGYTVTKSAARDRHWVSHTQQFWSHSKTWAHRKDRRKWREYCRLSRVHEVVRVRNLFRPKLSVYDVV
jgi:hypothetical protein